MWLSTLLPDILWGVIDSVPNLLGTVGRGGLGGNGQWQWLLYLFIHVSR